MRVRWLVTVMFIMIAGVTGAWGATVVPAVTTSVSPKGSGTVSPNRWEFQPGQTQEFAVQPAVGYEIKKVTVNGVADLAAPGLITEYKFTVTPDPLKKNKVAVLFAKRKLTLTVQTPTGGNIAPKTLQVLYGTSKKFTITPQSGNVIDKVTLDGADVSSQLVAKGKSAVKSLTLTNVTENHTIAATFVPKAQVSALKLAEKVSVVEAKAEVQAQPVRALRAPSLAPGVGSDYVKDQTRVYVDERSAEAFNTVNEILCMLGQTRYDAMLNKGDYKAQINKKLCAAAEAATESESSSSAAPDYLTWTLNAARTDNASPQIVKAWVHEEDEGRQKLIEAKLEITEGPSDTNPYGLFILNFKGLPVENGVPVTTAPEMKGYMKSEVVDGKVRLIFGESAERNGHSESEWVVVSRNDDGTSGQGTIGRERSDETPSVFDIAFNADFFHRVAGDKDVCFDRNAFEESAWRYGLYDAESGARVVRNSGFPVRKVSGAKTYYGWVGYWGMWFPNTVTVANGDTLLAENAEDRAHPVPYTVVKADGKLKKHVKKFTTLGAVKNVPLQMWMQSEMGNARVAWDGATFVKSAVMSCGDQGCSGWQEVAPAPLNLSALNWDELSFWSESLGGQARVKLTCTPNGQQGMGMTTYNCSANDDLQVVYYTEDLVYPDDDTVPAALRCYDNCPQVDATGIIGASQGGQEASDYTFSTQEMLLKKDGLAAILKNQQMNNGSFMSGPLFDPTDQAVLAKLNCNFQWDPQRICGWKAWSELDSFYTWESGFYDWNKFVALKDGNGTVKKFDPPLQVTYVHSQPDAEAPDHKYDGTKFFLNYNGFGELQGIPGKCVDMDSGNVVSQCNESTRWVAEFTINGGDTVSAGTTEYLVKPLEKSQRMQRVETGCETLEVASFPAPQGLWVDPQLGKEPAVNASPAVIGGVVQ